MVTAPFTMALSFTRTARFRAVGAQKTTPIPEGAEVVDYGDKIVAPGLIDIHIHGYQSKMCGSSLENTLGLAEYAAKAGVANILPPLLRWRA